LVFVPAGIATGLCKVPPIVVFACNAIAIVPLSSLLAFATECIASDLGDTVGALMNISFGNLIEVIMFVTALAHDEIYVVQGALVGSILVNLLLILGTAIIAGEFQPLEMVYDMNNAQALACLLSLSVFSILIPVSNSSVPNNIY
jgi:Ca2+:H+ antiporter